MNDASLMTRRQYGKAGEIKTLSNTKKIVRLLLNPSKMEKVKNTRRCTRRHGRKLTDARAYVMEIPWLKGNKWKMMRTKKEEN